MKNYFISRLLCSFFLFSYIQPTVSLAASFSGSHIKTVEIKDKESDIGNKFRELNTHLFLNKAGIGPEVLGVNVSFKIKDRGLPYPMTLSKEFQDKLAEIHPQDFNPSLFEREVIEHLKQEHVRDDVKLPEKYNIAGVVIEMKKYEGDLFELIEDAASKEEALSKNAFWDIMESICGQIEKMHRLGVAHLDLKPENIFYEFDQNSNIQIVIADFGFSRALDFANGFIGGTPEYVTPDQARSTIEKIDYGNTRETAIQKDYWTIGLIAYYLINQETLFKSIELEESKTKSESKSFIIPEFAIPEISEFKGLTKEQMKGWGRKQKILIQNLLKPDFSERRIVLPKKTKKTKVFEFIKSRLFQRKK